MASRKGELRVNVISAKGLRDTAIFGIQDPYVQLVYGGLKVKTAVHIDGGTSPVWNESIKLHTAKDSPTKLVVKVKNSHTLHDNRVGTTEVDLSDVFTNKHEEVSLPLFTRDGRQKGEVQLAFTFHPFCHSPHGSQHGPSASVAPVTEAPPQVSPQVSPQVTPQVSPHKAEHRAESQGTGLRAGGFPEPALQPSSADDSLGPLGRSFMNLAMSHISPSTTSAASKPLADHAYLQLGKDHEGVFDSPSALTGQAHSPSPGQPSSSGVTAPLHQRNFYPEEASDDESHMPSQHSRRTSAAGESGSVLPAEFRCPQPSNTGMAPAADETADQASYSSQEVYHAYRTRDFSGHHTHAQLSSSQYGAQMTSASPSRQGHELQPQVPAWRLLGTSPLLEGQQHAQEKLQQQHHQQQQQQQQQQRQQQPQQQQWHSGDDQQHSYERQAQVPQWRLLGTSPLQEGQMQHLGQPQQVHAGQQFQPWRHSYSQPAPGQGSSQQALGQGHQSLPQQPEWHLMDEPVLQSGHMACDPISGSTSQSFTNQGMGLSYASLAVGSWSDGVNQSQPFARRVGSQTGVQGSAPSLPVIGPDAQSVTSTSNSQAFAGFSNVSRSHDSTQVASNGRLTGRPPCRSRSRANVANPGSRSLPFSDLGVDRKFALSTSHDRRAVI